MLKKWIYDTTITLQESVESWPQALEICAKPLLDLQVIGPEYVTAIIEQHHALGPYYVLAPGLAMPHARPEEGAKGLGLSLLKLKRESLLVPASSIPWMLLLCSRRRINTVTST